MRDKSSQHAEAKGQLDRLYKIIFTGNTPGTFILLHRCLSDTSSFMKPLAQIFRKKMRPNGNWSQLL